MRHMLALPFTQKKYLEYNSWFLYRELCLRDLLGESDLSWQTP